MRCLCETNETNGLKVEADVGTDPIWCRRCNCNLDIEEAPLSLDLKSELVEWISNYGEWIDWDKDEIVANGIHLEDEHNKQGWKLTNQAQQELEGQYTVSFSPSSFARNYTDEK